MSESFWNDEYRALECKVNIQISKMCNKEVEQ